MRETKAYKEGGCAKPDKNINEIAEKIHKKTSTSTLGIQEAQKSRRTIR
jgi:hypothetical protein